MTFGRVARYLQDAYDLCEGLDYVQFAEKNGVCTDDEG